MEAVKRVSVSFRVPPQFKRCLEIAAESEQRSLTNMLAWIVLDFCRRKGIPTATAPDLSSGKEIKERGR